MDFAERVIPGLSSNYMFRQAQARYMFAKKYIKNKDQVLDAACGTGYGTTGVGIDNNPEAIAFAKKHFKAKYVLGDVLNMPFSSNLFDVVTSFETIEHVDAKKFLNEISRVLKKDGKLILSTPQKKGLSNSPYHIKEFSKDELYHLLKKYFKSVKIFGQVSSVKAQKAWNDFMSSQESRKKIIIFDTLGFRKLFPKELKERIWKPLGNLVSKRGTQEKLTEKDFQIVEFSNFCQTLIAVCSR
jgi:ubiquinone/menaquinone biosynthesis C-methylase UbiE